jgi:cytochrome c-type biogenesis protein CcmH/NrfG
MAVPRLLCGKCGGALAPGQDPCPRCGEPVETVPFSSSPILCPVCGHENAPGSAVCASCGVRLGSSKRPKGRSRSPRAPEPAGKKRFEPWQAASAVAVIALIGFVIYLEWGSGPKRETAPAPGAAPLTMPQMTPHGVDLAPLEAAVRQSPGDADALLQLANGQHDAGQFTAAIATYGRYLRLKPDDPDARVDMGICYFELGRMDTSGAADNYLAALREMRTALDRNPTHQPAAFNLGVVHLAMGNIEESRTWLSKALSMNRDSDLGRRAQKMLEQHSF